jgi:hypothetical protein
MITITRAANKRARIWIVVNILQICKFSSLLSIVYGSANACTHFTTRLIIHLQFRWTTVYIKCACSLIGIMQILVEIRNKRVSPKIAVFFLKRH